MCRTSLGLMSFIQLSLLDSATVLSDCMAEFSCILSMEVRSPASERRDTALVRVPIDPLTRNMAPDLVW